MSCVRHSGAPVRIRLRASFYTAVAVTVALLIACCYFELTAPGGDIASRRLSFYPSDAILTEPYHEDPHRWAVILHCIGIGYMLLGLNTVCDVYFTGALDIMVEQWNIKPDVAGATFMAAGGSAPEFFTSLIGTTWFISDVGFSTIVGSAVFNVLFVIGLCGFVARGEIKLTWWPLFRDCTYYIFGLSLLAGFAMDRKIGLVEALILFLAYIVYCIIMYYNPMIEALVDRKIRRANKQVAPEDSMHSEVSTPSGRKVMPIQETESAASTADASTPIVITAACPSTFGKMDEEYSDTPIVETTSSTYLQTPSTNAQSSWPCQRSSMATTMATVDTGIDTSIAATGKPSEVLSSIGDSDPREGISSIGDTPGSTKVPVEVLPEAEPHCQEETSPAEVDVDKKSKEGEEEEEEDEHFMDWPEGRFNQCIWCASLPIYLPLYWLIPWPRAERHIFVATFSISLVWIAGFAFLLVWWVHTLGQVMAIKDVIMNFTLLAMGTSIPDAASSVAVARAGQGDMAVSSSIGSNVFDILVGLPVPWMIKVFIEGGNLDFKVSIFSEYLTFYVLLLLAMVFSVILSIHFLGWKLNMALGGAMAVLYMIFLAIAIYVEIETPSALKM